MAADYTVSGFLEDVRRKGRLPSASSSSFSDADLVAFANEEVLADIVPMLLEVREEYLDYSSTSAAAATIAIPTDAIGSTLRLVQWAATSADPYRPLNRIEPERAGDLGYGGTGPVGFMLEGNNIVLLPLGATFSGTVKLTYPKRPTAIQTTGSIDSAIPLEALPYLALRVAYQAWDSEGDPKAQPLAAKVEMTRAKVKSLLAPRTDGNARVILNKHAPGWGTRRRGF